MTIVGAVSSAVDTYAREHGGRTDLGEMAQMAAVESLVAVVGPTLPSLFGPSPSDVQRAIGRLASGDRFSALARAFFSRLTQRTLDYYLSRELSNHIGGDRRFSDDGARSQFDAALERHCWEAARIIEDICRRVVRQGGLSDQGSDASMRLGDSPRWPSRSSVPN